MGKEVEMYPGAKEQVEKKEVDVMEETKKQHAMWEQHISDLNDKYKVEMAKHVKDKDVEIKLSGEDFLHIINLLVTLKDHNFVTRQMLSQTEHLMKQDDIRVMGVLGIMMKKWASLDLEGKLVDVVEETKED